MIRRMAALAALGALGALILAGCGGGGSTSVAASGRTAVLITDSPREDYAHIWATIYHAELTTQAGAVVALYDDPSGKLIDLRTLRDAAGARFSFLGSATVPAGTYTGVNVTVGATMQLFRNGAAVGEPLPVDKTIPVDALGHPVLSLTFPAPRNLGPTTPSVVIDFDLAHFVVGASGVLPLIKPGDPAGVGDPARHNPDEYVGVISALSGTSPDLTFTLTGRAGESVTVVTTASTAVYGPVALANGVLVAVEGKLDAATGSVGATRVEVCPAAGPPPAMVVGAASALDAAAGKFVLTYDRARGLTPGSTTVNVVTGPQTIYRVDTGAAVDAAAFFAALTANPTATANGAYDAATNTLTAQMVRAVNPANDHGPQGGPGGGPPPFRPGANAGNWGNGAGPRPRP